MFNNNTSECEIRIPVWQIGVTNRQVMRRIFLTDASGFTEEAAVYPVLSGEMTITMAGTSAVILIAEDPSEESTS